MGNKRVPITDPDLAKVGAALKRAAAKARQLGFDTNTPVYVFRNGKIVDIVAEHRTASSPPKGLSKERSKKDAFTLQKSTIKKTPDKATI